MSTSDILRETTQAYDRISTVYAGLHPSTDEMKRELEQFSELVSGGIVLDVGCGNGRDLQYLARKGYTALGIDLSAGLLRIARRNHSELALMDMRRLGFSSHSFEGLWVCASFLHIPKTQARPTLREFYRILKPGGVLYVSVKEGEGERFVESDQGFRRFFPFIAQESWKQLSRRNGSY
jgi:ubiquinone/menaquinone biosynthesis C-methylase UbiE